MMISYLKGDVAPDDHLFYKQVYLRVMPINGGKAESCGLCLQRTRNVYRSLVVTRQHTSRFCHQVGYQVIEDY